MTWPTQMGAFCATVGPELGSDFAQGISYGGDLIQGFIPKASEGLEAEREH